MFNYLFTWRVYILWQGYKANSMCGTLSKVGDEIRNTFFQSFGTKK
jgi:hypothetical protein